MATIDRNDIAPADPLKIVGTGGTRLLDVKIVQANNEPSQFETTLNADGKTAAIAFDFLDRDHGVVLQIIHTGTSGSDITITGTIKGAGTPVQRRIRGVFLPLPTSAEFDLKLHPRTRRRITLLCEMLGVLSLVTISTCILLAWFFPGEWASIVDAWKMFESTHSVAALGVQAAIVLLSYVLLSVAMYATLLFRAATLPVSLMALVDDPLEK